MAYRKVQLTFYDHPITCPHCKTSVVFTTAQEAIKLAEKTCPKCSKIFVIENGKPSRTLKKKPTATGSI